MKMCLWEVRNEKKISGRMLAKKTGLSKSTIYNIECGKTSPTLAQLEKLAKGLGVGMVDLFESEYKYIKTEI